MAVEIGEFVIPPRHVTALESKLAEKPGTWHVVSATPETGTYALCCDMGDGNMALANIVLDVSPVLDMNAEMLNNAQGKRFGTGQIVARIPMSLRFAKNALGGLGEALDAQDFKHARNILNDSDYRALRSFPGRL